MLLLDTQLLLRLAYTPERLSARARRQLEDPAVPLAFSLASIWEVAIKTSLSRPNFAVDPALLHRSLLSHGFTEVTITAPHLIHVARLPWVHRDPFDRMLVAQALEEGLTLLTSDATLKGFGRFVTVVLPDDPPQCRSRAGPAGR